MILELTISPEILKNLFIASPQNNMHSMVISRLQLHKLIYSTELKKEWDNYMEENGLTEIYSDWLFYQSATVSKLQKVNKTKLSNTFGNSVEEALVETALSTKHKVVVGTIAQTTQVNNPNVKYVDYNIMASSKKNNINIFEITNYYDSNNLMKVDIFNLFECPVVINVNSGENANTLSKYFSEFYDNEMNIVQDDYISTNSNNEKNYNDYILRYISSCLNKTVIIHPKNRIPHKNRLESTYGITVNCNYDIHQGYIETKEYRIEIPYRMHSFGRYNKTTTSTITIHKK